MHDPSPEYDYSSGASDDTSGNFTRRDYSFDSFDEVEPYNSPDYKGNKDSENNSNQHKRRADEVDGASCQMGSTDLIDTGIGTYHTVMNRRKKLVISVQDRMVFGSKLFHKGMA